MIEWMRQWQWTPDAVIALAALILSAASWVHVLVTSSRRVGAYVKTYTVWPHYGGVDSTLLVNADLTNASILPIGVMGLAVRFGREWHYAERWPKRQIMGQTYMGETPFEEQQVRVSEFPRNLDPSSGTPIFFAASGSTQFMPPQCTKARMRFRTVRGYTRCTLKFDPSRYMTPDEFLAVYKLVNAPSAEP